MTRKFDSQMNTHECFPDNMLKKMIHFHITEHPDRVVLPAVMKFNGLLSVHSLLSEQCFCVGATEFQLGYSDFSLPLDKPLQKCTLTDPMNNLVDR